MQNSLKNTPRISVLVAVYNTEEYLPQCLDSLRAQSLSDFEVFCVDDASTDKSLSLLEHYAEEDARFHVIHLTRNQGQAHARNLALRQCSTPYVCFLDSDDWLSHDALQQVADTFDTNDRTDCVVFRVVNVDNDTKTETEMPQPPFEAVDGRQAFLWSLDWTLHGIYAIRTALHKAHPYDESCRAYSDDNTTRIHYYLSREVRPCNGIYYYRRRSQSVTHNVSYRRLDYLKATESMKRSLKELNVTDPWAWRLFEQQRWLTLIDTCWFVYSHGRELLPQELEKGLRLMHDVWRDVDTKLLPWRLKAKFGYMPLRFSWALFCWQERFYFFLRDKLHREKNV